MGALHGLFLFLLIFAIVLTGGFPGPGAQDWVSEPIVDNYVIVRSSAHHITLGRELGQGLCSTVVEAKVVAVAWNAHFISAQQTAPPKTGEKDTLSTEVDYYIVRISSAALYGPMTEQAYLHKCLELGVGTLSQWVDVQDLPRQEES